MQRLRDDAAQARRALEQLARLCPAAGPSSWPGRAPSRRPQPDTRSAAAPECGKIPIHSTLRGDQARDTSGRDTRGMPSFSDCFGKVWLQKGYSTSI
jgi:hypothetical protein